MIALRAVERSHTALSPSSFERVSNCSMSYRLTQGRLGRPVSTEAASWGTAAHCLLEWALKTGGDPETVEVVAVEGRRFRVDVRMREAVGVALDWVKAELAGRELLVEHQVALPWNRITGWLDIATSSEPWVVADFKSGWSPVRADSSQLALYALALLLERRGSVEGVGEVRTVVIQPRAAAAPIRSHVWTFEALRELRDRLLDTLDAIRRGDLSYSDGPWCRWCPVAGVCPHLGAVARDFAAAQLTAPELVADGSFGAEALEAALEIAPALERRIRAVHEVAKDYLLAGGKLRSHKLVAKRDGGLTAVPRDDPRLEVHVGATLKAALRASLAHEIREQVNTETPPAGARARAQRRMTPLPVDG